MSTLLLGEGAYSTVYDNKDYAIKITEIKNEEDLTACVRELYILRMHLPNTVPFRSCYYKWGCMHFNLEKARCNLKKYKGTLSNEYIVASILQGLYALHQHNIYHRDIKPDNVLIKGDSVWLCDFGLSRQHCNEFSNGTGSVQTEYYRAPEIWKKTGVYTDTSDIWAVGCIYYKLIHNEHLYETEDELFDNVPDLIIKEKNELLKGMLDMDPASRWTAEQCLIYLQVNPEYTTPCRSPPTDTFTHHRNRELWFKKFEDKFPEEKRALTHALMLYDASDDDPENMSCAMAVSAMLFSTRPSALLHYAQKELKNMGCESLPEIASFLVAVCSGEHKYSGWELTDRSDQSYKEYMYKMFNKTRIL
jgi:serine/threonine protein kinase